MHPVGLFDKPNSGKLRGREGGLLDFRYVSVLSAMEIFKIKVVTKLDSESLNCHN